MDVKNSSSSGGGQRSEDSHSKEMFFSNPPNQERNLLTDPIKKNMLQARAFTPSAHS